MRDPLEPLRGEHYAYEHDDFEVQVTGSVEDGSRRATVVPRSLRNLAPEARELMRATLTAAAELERAVRVLEERVAAMREAGASWDAIGWCVGTTGSGARKRFGQ